MVTIIMPPACRVWHGGRASGGARAGGGGGVWTGPSKGRERHEIRVVARSLRRILILLPTHPARVMRHSCCDGAEVLCRCCGIVELASSVAI